MHRSRVRRSVRPLCRRKRVHHGQLRGRSLRAEQRFRHGAVQRGSERAGSVLGRSLPSGSNLLVGGYRSPLRLQQRWHVYYRAVHRGQRDHIRHIPAEDLHSALRRASGRDRPRDERRLLEHRRERGYLSVSHPHAVVTAAQVIAEISDLSAEAIAGSMDVIGDAATGPRPTSGFYAQLTDYGWRERAGAVLGVDPDADEGALLAWLNANGPTDGNSSWPRCPSRPCGFASRQGAGEPGPRIHVAGTRLCGQRRLHRDQTLGQASPSVAAPPIPRNPKSSNASERMHRTTTAATGATRAARLRASAWSAGGPRRPMPSACRGLSVS